MEGWSLLQSSHFSNDRLQNYIKSSRSIPKWRQVGHLELKLARLGVNLALPWPILALSWPLLEPRLVQERQKCSLRRNPIRIFRYFGARGIAQGLQTGPGAQILSDLIRFLQPFLTPCMTPSCITFFVMPRTSNRRFWLQENLLGVQHQPWCSNIAYCTKTIFSTRVILKNNACPRNISISTDVVKAGQIWKADAHSLRKKRILDISLETTIIHVLQVFTCAKHESK